MNPETLQVLYYALGIIGGVGAGVGWVWKHFTYQLAQQDKQHEALSKEFYEFRVTAGEKFATVEAVARIESKIDAMSDRMTRTLLSLFSGKNLKGPDDA